MLYFFPMVDQKEQLFTVSTKTIVKVLVVGFGLWFVYYIRDIVGIIFVAMILASLIDPAADWCEKKRLPRSFAVLAALLLIAGIITAVTAVLVPLVSHEAKELFGNLGVYWERLLSSTEAARRIAEEFGLIERFKSALDTFDLPLPTIGRIFSTITGIIGSIFSLVLIVVLTFYLTVQEKSIKTFMLSMAPVGSRGYVADLLTRIKTRLGGWVRGQIILSLAVGILAYAGLTILGVQYALLLAVIAAITEIIPYVGPVMGAIPALFLAFAQSPESPVKALLVLVLFVVIQQVENNLLVPKVMQRAVGLNPVVSIVALMIGVKFAGIVGGLLAIPVASAIAVFVEDIQGRRMTSV